MTKLPRSAPLPERLAPTAVASISRVVTLPATHLGGSRTEQDPHSKGPHCGLPRLAEPRRAQTNPCASYDESRQRKCRSTEAATSRPFQTRVPLHLPTLNLTSRTMLGTPTRFCQFSLRLQTRSGYSSIPSSHCSHRLIWAFCGFGKFLTHEMVSPCRRFWVKVIIEPSIELTLQNLTACLRRYCEESRLKRSNDRSYCE